MPGSKCILIGGRPIDYTEPHRARKSKAGMSVPPRPMTKQEIIDALTAENQALRSALEAIADGLSTRTDDDAVGIALMALKDAS
jgi:uncharacterized protein (DUF2342 family)